MPIGTYVVASAAPSRRTFHTSGRAPGRCEDKRRGKRDEAGSRLRRVSREHDPRECLVVATPEADDALKGRAVGQSLGREEAIEALGGISRRSKRNACDGKGGGSAGSMSSRSVPVTLTRQVVTVVDPRAFQAKRGAGSLGSSARCTQTAGRGESSGHARTGSRRSPAGRIRDDHGGRHYGLERGRRRQDDVLEDAMIAQKG